MRLQTLLVAHGVVAVAAAATATAAVVPAAAVVRHASGSVRAQTSSIGRTADSAKGISGLLVPIRGFACPEEFIVTNVLPSSAIFNSPDSERSSPPFIALVERGQCAFVDKVRHLQSAGFAAVVVGDNIDPADLRVRSRLVTMVATDDEPADDIVIPSYFVSSVGYNALLDAISSQRRKEPAPVSLFSNISAFLFHLWRFLANAISNASSSEAVNSNVPSKYESFLSVKIEPSTFYDKVFLIFLLLTAPLFLSFLLQLLQWLTVLKTLIEDLAASRLVLSLPTRKWDAGNTNKSDILCAICLEEYATGDQLRILPCRHEFHTDCVDRWLATAVHTCPLCKQAINRRSKPFQLQQPPDIVSFASTASGVSLHAPSPRLRNDSLESALSASAAGDTFSAMSMADAGFADHNDVQDASESWDRAMLLGIFMPSNDQTSSATSSSLAQLSTGSSFAASGEYRQVLGINARTRIFGEKATLLDASTDDEEDEGDAVVPHVP
ncbi:hypothetical protein HDU84_008537 [Entophlyctis sp. JEL0112]|nr:hypothetical protein HDU84_008537 [Entophlyctis sp. JEL0112]